VTQHQQRADKRHMLEHLFARGPVLVHVDARRPDVRVPAQFRDDGNLVLRFGYNLVPAIRDLEVSSDGISGTLVFAGQPFYCHVPWTAVFAARVGGENHVTMWHLIVPEAADAPAPPREEPVNPPRGGHLKLV
jgi:stringent starvation protein B